MNNINLAIKNRNAGMLQALMPKDEVPRLQERASQLFNILSIQLQAVFPAMKTYLKNQSELDEFRRQWVMAFAENGITTVEQINSGMRIARKQESPFLPSPGQFVTWCKQGQMQSMGLPSVDEAIDEFNRYCRLRDDYPCAEHFPWRALIMYWVVVDMRKAMLQHNLSSLELKKLAEKSLHTWGEKILKGEDIPAPAIQLQDKQPPTTKGAEKGWETDKTKMLGKAALAEIRAKTKKPTKTKPRTNQ